MEGQALAGYRIEHEIGRGGQAVVYRAVQVDFGQVVALKILAPGAQADRDSRARFEREATSGTMLAHPHVLPVYEAGEDDGRCFIATRYVAGGGLAERIRRDGALAVPEALELLGQFASALDHAHAEGIVHRDVKPANVLVGGNRHAYLADFGLARHAQAPALTPIGAWIGKPKYAAPEVLRGEEPAPASDRYAFSLLAYEALPGRVAFPRSTPAAIIYSHLNDSPPRAIDVRPGLGKRVSSELAKGMDKRPDRRPSSSSELVERLSTAITATPGALEAAAPVKVAVPRERFMSPRLAATLGPQPMHESLAGRGGSGRAVWGSPVLPRWRSRAWPSGCEASVALPRADPSPAARHPLRPQELRRPSPRRSPWSIKSPPGRRRQMPGGRFGPTRARTPDHLEASNSVGPRGRAGHLGGVAPRPVFVVRWSSSSIGPMGSAIGPPCVLASLGFRCRNCLACPTPDTARDARGRWLTHHERLSEPTGRSRPTRTPRSAAATQCIPPGRGRSSASTSRSNRPCARAARDRARP